MLGGYGAKSAGKLGGKYDKTNLSSKCSRNQIKLSAKGAQLSTKNVIKIFFWIVLLRNVYCVYRK